MPHPVLTDDLLVKIAENGELRGIKPSERDDGRVVWRTRIVLRSIPHFLGAFRTPQEAIDAVRHQANCEWSFSLSDEELFWPKGVVKVRGVVFIGEHYENPWEAFLTRNYERRTVGFYPDFASAYEARVKAEKEVGFDGLDPRVVVPDHSTGAVPDVLATGRFAYDVLTTAAEGGFVRGVSRDKKTGLWRARLYAKDGPRLDLGRKFPSPRVAVDAVRRAAERRQEPMTDEELFVIRKTSGEPKSRPLGFPGISWHRQSGKWRVVRTRSGKLRHIGLFPTLIEAVAASQAS